MEGSSEGRGERERMEETRLGAEELRVEWGCAGMNGSRSGLGVTSGIAVCCAKRGAQVIECKIAWLS